MNQSNTPRSTGRNQSGSRRRPKGPFPGLPNPADTIRRVGARVQKSYIPNPAIRVRSGMAGLSLGDSSFTRQSAGRAPAQVAAAYASGQATAPPRITADRNTSRIVHRELISSVSGSSAFAVAASFALNPGISATFPWLSTQAQSWEQYRFNLLRFCFYTRTGSTTVGSLMMVPDYDAADAAPASEQIASSYEDVSEDAPWKDIACVLRPSAMHSNGPKKFVRSGPLPANLDIKTYDAGNLFVCTTDGSAVGWGKLWVEYDVTLSVPQLNPQGVLDPDALFIHATSSTPSTNELLPSSTVVAGTLAVTVTGNTITLPSSGKYFLQYDSTATTSVTVNTADFVLVGCTFMTAYGGGNGYFSSGNGTGSNSLGMWINVTGQTGSIQDTSVTFVLPLTAELLVQKLPLDA